MSADPKPKYLNSPEGEIYKKSETLYGIDLARSPIAKARRAIVVEGYTDVLALHQAGIEEAVAIMGTAITPEQLQDARGGGSETVVLALDADRAGADAMIRAQRVAGSQSLDLLVAAMPEGEDPADMLAAGEIERFKGLVEEAIDLPSFRVRTALGRADVGTPTGRERALAEIGAGAEGDGRSRWGGTSSCGRSPTGSTPIPRWSTRGCGRRARGGAGAASRAARRRRPGWRGAGAGTRLPAAVPLTPRENARAGAARDVRRRPEDGRGLHSPARPEHMSASGRPALEWLRDHLDDPLSGLPREDQELLSLVTELEMRADREPAPTELGMDLNFMLLEQQRLEDGIAAAREAGDLDAVERASAARARH